MMMMLTDSDLKQLKSFIDGHNNVNDSPEDLTKAIDYYINILTKTNK